MEVLTQTLSVSPIELMNKYKNGERPEYKPSNTDKPQKELEALAEKYKQTMSVDTKVELLNKELGMLYEEIQHPELTLSRNYEDISKVMPKNIRGQELEDTLKLFDITGITRMERLGGVYRHKTPEERIDILKEAYKTFDETNASGNRAKSFIITVLSNIEERNPEHKSKISEVYDELYKVTNSE
mgnify:CR=1 FL=1